MRTIVVVLIAAACFLSCKKDNTRPGKTVEIYLLKNYQTVTGKCQVDAATSQLQDTAMILNRDILEYSHTEYKFRLSDNGIQKVKTLRDWAAFAVTVDKQVIYYGFFKPSISSSSCDNSITMDIDWPATNKIVLRLGYPGLIQGVTIDDQRNNAKLLVTLKSQGKLK